MRDARPHQICARFFRARKSLSRSRNGLVGGLTYTIARILAQNMRTSLRQAIIIANKTTARRTTAALRVRPPTAIGNDQAR
jgi:hypothetical protein